MILRRDAMPVSALVELVNGWGTQPRLQAEEQDTPFPPWASVGAMLSLPAAPESLTGRRRLCALADALYPVFAADTVADRVSLVNGLLDRCRVRPTVGVTAGRAEEAWTVARESDVLLAAAAICLREQLVEHGAERLGTCAGARCADAYVDASPGGRRRYCSITCQNRNRVAAFRRRRAAANPSTAGRRQA